MYSKEVLRKMAQELQVKTLVSLAHETLNGIEDASAKSLDAISATEVVIAELKKRFPQEQQQQQQQQQQAKPATSSRRRKSEEQQQQTGGEAQ